MGGSTFIRVFDDMLLEYIPDSGKVLSESYSILVNFGTGLRCFSSTTLSTHNYVDNVVPDVSRNMPSVTTNQLVCTDPEYDLYTPFTSEMTNIQRVDYPQGFPITYSELRVHLPTEYTFDDLTGIRFRVYVVDRSGNYVDLSNYYMDLTEPDRLNEVEYVGESLYAYESDWGKYLYVRFPSPVALAGQVRNGVVRPGTINDHLTSGAGIDINCPLLVDISFITSKETVNGRVVYKTGEQKSVSFPLSDDKDGLGVTMRKSDQGDFFEIFPTYGGSLGGFRNFIRETSSRGARYRTEIRLEVSEMNLSVSEVTFLMDTDAFRPIIYRPVLKFATTTAILDATLVLTNEVTGASMTRFTTYVMLQDELADYSARLTRLNFTKRRFDEVIYRSDTNVPVAGRDFTPVPELRIVPDSFRLFSHVYRMSVSDRDLTYLDRVYVRDRKTTVTLYPMDNIIELYLVTSNDGNTVPFDLSGYGKMSLVFKDEKKEVSAPLYTDSGMSGLSSGQVTFKLKSDHYVSVREMFDGGMTKCRLVARSGRKREVLMTAEFVCWDSPVTVRAVEKEFEQRQLTAGPGFIFPVRPEESAPEGLDFSLDTSDETRTEGLAVNTENSPEGLSGRLETLWKGVWDSPYEVLLYSYEKGGDFSIPFDNRSFGILLSENGLLNMVVDNVTGSFDVLTQRRINAIISYLRIHDLSPSSANITFLSGYVEDIDRWVSSGKDGNKRGSNRPQGGEIVDLLRLLIKNKDK